MPGLFLAQIYIRTYYVHPHADKGAWQARQKKWGKAAKEKKAEQSGTEHATLIFIDFILTPKKANAWKLNRWRNPFCPFVPLISRQPRPGLAPAFAWQSRDYIKLARRQTGRKARIPRMAGMARRQGGAAATKKGSLWQFA